MSKIQVNEIVNHFDNGAPDCPRGLTVTGVSTFSGNVSIGGTLSYEDVTNIDSVGIITAQSGINVGPTSGIGITISANGNITAAGTATFADNIQSGGNPVSGTATGAQLNSSGGVWVSHGTGTQSVFRGYTTGNSTETIRINANGSITAAGNIVSSAGNFQGFEFIGTQSTSTFGVFKGKLNSTVTTEILADGTATFKNKLTVQVDSASAVDTVDIFNGTSGGDNRVKIRTFANGGGDPYVFFDGGGNNMVVGLSYAGTTSNQLVMGTGNSASGVTGLRINGLGKVLCDDSFYISSTATTNALKFLYDVTSGSATIGPDSNGGSTQLYLGASNSGTYQNYVQINNAGSLTNAIIDGVNGSNCIVARHWNAGSVGPYLYLGYSQATTFGNGTYRFSVSSNGDVKNTNNSYSAISDITLKENIVDVKSQWDDIKNLRLRNYNFKEGIGYETNTQIGLIAQEAEIICPNIVETFTVPEEEERSLKSIKYSILYMKAIKALQEAMTRIETLEVEVQALKGS